MRLDVLNVFRSTDEAFQGYKRCAADAQGVSVDRANVSAWIRTVLDRSVSQRLARRISRQEREQ
jgi:hypothetical protein